MTIHLELHNDDNDGYEAHLAQQDADEARGREEGAVDAMLRAEEKLAKIEELCKEDWEGYNAAHIIHSIWMILRDKP